jgi:hypothetical protein
MTAGDGYLQRQRRLVRLYRTRAREALHKARQARKAGDLQALRSCLVAVRFWRRAASAWARKATRT